MQRGGRGGRGRGRFGGRGNDILMIKYFQYFNTMNCNY